MKASKSYMRIGIVEDDPSISGLLSETLERIGHTPNLYPDGWSFLEALTNDQNTEPFDRVVVDVLLPGSISGLEVINYLRITRPNLPIVVVSAIDSDNLASIQRQFPGIKVLHKPFHLTDLQTSIEA